jgi:hypothetical protein
MAIINHTYQPEFVEKETVVMHAEAVEVSACSPRIVNYTSGYRQTIFQQLLHVVLSAFIKSSPAGLCPAADAALLLEVILCSAWS